MTNKLNTVLVLSALVTAGLISAMPAKAQYYSQGEEKLSIVVDKTISDIVDANYYDNISASKRIFREKDKIDFKIVVQNSGNSTLTGIKVIDYLPNYLQVINGFGATNNNQVETIIDSLGVGETKTYNIRAVISGTPVEKIINQKWQMTNRVCVSNDRANDCDNASYFVGGKVLPVTGNETMILQTLMVMGTGLAAVGLKKLIRGY